MSTLAEILQNSRVFAYRNAVAAALAAELPEVEIATHPGKLDIADIVEGSSFRAPSVHVAIAEQRSARHWTSGPRDVPLKTAFYVVAEDLAVGDPPRLVMRDELGIALCDRLCMIIENPWLSRWGLEDIAYPEEVEARPLLTVKSLERGTAYYAVTFRQTLIGVGEPFWSPGEPHPPLLHPAPENEP